MAVDIFTKLHDIAAVPAYSTVDKNQFEELVIALKEALGPSSGLDSDDVDVGALTELMRNYNSAESDWSQYAFADAGMGYTRNLIDEGNGKSNLVCVQS